MKMGMVFLLFLSMGSFLIGVLSGAIWGAGFIVASAVFLTGSFLHGKLDDIFQRMPPLPPKPMAEKSQAELITTTVKTKQKIDPIEEHAVTCPKCKRASKVFAFKRNADGYGKCPWCNEQVKFDY